MNYSTDFMQVLATVSQATGIPASYIFTHRKGQGYYDARWIAVELLHELGYYSGQISELTGTTQRNVNKIISAIKGRKGCTWRMFNEKLERCRNAIGIGPHT